MCGHKRGWLMYLTTCIHWVGGLLGQPIQGIGGCRLVWQLPLPRVKLLWNVHWLFTDLIICVWGAWRQGQMMWGTPSGLKIRNVMLHSKDFSVHPQIRRTWSLAGPANFLLLPRTDAHCSYATSSLSLFCSLPFFCASAFPRAQTQFSSHWACICLGPSFYHINHAFISGCNSKLQCSCLLTLKLAVTLSNIPLPVIIDCFEYLRYLKRETAATSNNHWVTHIFILAECTNKLRYVWFIFRRGWSETIEGVAIQVLYCCIIPPLCWILIERI